MRRIDGRLKDRIRNVSSFLVLGIFLGIGFYFGWSFSKQIENEAHEVFDDIVRPLKWGGRARVAGLKEITDYMSNIAAAVGGYHEQENSLPPSLYSMEDIKSRLNVSISTNKIFSIAITSLGPEEITITAIITGIDSEIDGKALTLTGILSKQYGFLWIWGGTVPSGYLPKGKIKSRTVF